MMSPLKPPAPRLRLAQQNAEPPSGNVRFSQPPTMFGHRVVIYGPGGIGKTTLACMAPGPVAVFDLDESLPVLRPQIQAEHLNQVDYGPSRDWQGVRDALNQPGWDEVRTIVVDSATKAEELAVEWVLKNVRHEKGNRIERIEDYGFGKGYTHIYEAFLSMLGDLDRHVRAGRNVIMICHDCTANVPNPSGDDYIRYEPRLQSPPSGKNSIRLRVREWADHVLFCGYDVEAKDGKASVKSCETRTIYPLEMPHCMAKSRALDRTIGMQKHSTELWERIFA